MSEQYDPFSPHRVDESVEHLASTSPFDDTTPIEPEKRMGNLGCVAGLK